MTPAGAAGTASGQYRAEPPRVEGVDGLWEKLSEALGQLAMRGGYGLGVLASERLAEDLLPVVREIAAEEVAPLLARLRAVEEEIAEEETRRADYPAWEISVLVPAEAGDEIADLIFDAVADAAYEAQPEDRIDWDIFVSATKNPTSVPTHLIRRALDAS